MPSPHLLLPYIIFFFFFNDTATTEIYTLSLHDALPISQAMRSPDRTRGIRPRSSTGTFRSKGPGRRARSEEHTSELQSRLHLVCRLLLEKKKKKIKTEIGCGKTSQYACARGGRTKL